MIPVVCAHCASKFRVKDELAGRTGPCPTCKKPVVVPRPSANGGPAPIGPADALPTRMRQAGPEAHLTVDSPTQARGRQPSVVDLLTGQARPQSPYTVEGEIARGGMGAVVRAIDGAIRREVAIKYMLDESDEAKKVRFVEEAQITGQLEHPNIVPIHELGIDGKRRLFFAMKMVRGRSLAQILKELHEHSATAEKTWSLGRLLNIFVGVCHALAYAHSRGVIHRDLKPANIMVGDFGEVYVMDWGLAKVLGTPEDDEQPAAETPPSPALLVAPTSASSSTTDDSHGATCAG